MAKPEVIEQVESRTETRLAPPWQVIVHNDPITLQSYVTMVLQRLFAYDHAKAHSLMMEVHLKGRAIVWTGARERAELYLQQLHGHHLLASVEPVSE